MGNGLPNPTEGGGKRGNRCLAKTLSISMGRKLNELGGGCVNSSTGGSVNLAGLGTLLAEGCGRKNHAGSEKESPNPARKKGRGREGICGHEHRLPGYANRLHLLGHPAQAE